MAGASGNPLIRRQTDAGGADSQRRSGRWSRIGYGWVVVGALTVILTFSAGARFLFGVVLKPVSEEFGWDRAALTGAVVVSMLSLSICQPVVGWLIDRVGPKRILVVGCAVLGAALIPLSFATRLWQVYLLYGVVAAVGLAATSPVNATALVGRWFQERRGTALAIATSGAAFGQLLIVPLATWTLTMTDWQTTYRVLALTLIVGMVPLGLFLLRDAPGDAPAVARRAVAAEPAATRLAGASLRQALTTPAFWLLSFGFVTCGSTMAFPNIHFIAYADDMGMSVLHAANAVAVTAIFSIVGSLLLGILADRYRRPTMLALTYVLRGGAFALLLLLPSGNLIFAYAVVLGVSWTATTPLTAAIAADLYGPRHLGVIFGSMFTFMNLGVGVGAFLAGLIYERTGGYELALVINLVLALLAAAGVWTVADDRRHAADHARPITVAPAD